MATDTVLILVLVKQDFSVTRDVISVDVFAFIAVYT